MTTPIDPVKDFTDEDIQGLALRVANNAVQSAEASNRAAVYSSALFREKIYNAALEMLRAAVMHERQRAGRDIENLKQTHWN